MERYPLDEVTFGVEDSCLWVTLGFSSPLERNDLLHIVCATSVDAQDRRSGMADLYLERFDQAYSCYGGADLVLVTPALVDLRLNARGCDALRFDGAVMLDVPESLHPYRDALLIFRRMLGLECGARIRIEGAG